MTGRADTIEALDESTRAGFAALVERNNGGALDLIARRQIGNHRWVVRVVMVVEPSA